LARYCCLIGNHPADTGVHIRKAEACLFSFSILEQLGTDRG
jgi:hypothetical protein